MIGTPRARRWAPPLPLALAALAALAGPGAAAAAGDLPGVALALRSGRVLASADLAPVLPADLQERLGNGLRNVVAVFVALVPEDGSPPTIAQGRIFDVLYDVWEEAWAVTVRDPQSPGGRPAPVRTAAELRGLLARGADADLGPPSALPAGPFAVEVRVDVNPISPELLARTREYLAGSAGPGGSSRSVLGTVAGFLLREPEDDAESYLFRSPRLTATAVRP